MFIDGQDNNTEQEVNPFLTWNIRSADMLPSQSCHSTCLNILPSIFGLRMKNSAAWNQGRKSVLGKKKKIIFKNCLQI